MIGILAGMGPRSTAPFVDMVVTECQLQYGAREDIDFPPMMIYSLPAPFTMQGPLDHEAIRSVIRAGLKRLAATGVRLIAMPCNTAHMYYPELVAGLEVPLLNMIEEAARAIPDSAQRIGLLGTRFTVEAGLYQRELEKFNRQVLDVSPWQTRVDELILMIKTAPDLRPVRQAWAELMRTLEKERVDAAVVACTDLNAVIDSENPPLSMVDATRVLARALVRQWRMTRVSVPVAAES